MIWIIEGVLAGLIAGVIMGCISQLGYWLGILKSHLIVIDAEFALHKIRLHTTAQAIYSIGVFCTPDYKYDLWYYPRLDCRIGRLRTQKYLARYCICSGTLVGDAI